MKQSHVIFAAIALFAVAGLTVTTTFAQTNGMDRREDRRDNREEGREEKAACKAGDEKSRPECRQDKRDTKQEGRGDEKSETEKPEGT